MRSAGRPISPTLHPRTRPEATDNATKMRATGDWFRHDGKNVEEAPPPAVRLQGYVAPDVAEKNKGKSTRELVVPSIGIAIDYTQYRHRHRI